MNIQKDVSIIKLKVTPYDGSIVGRLPAGRCSTIGLCAAAGPGARTMLRTAYTIDKRYLAHDPPEPIPERPDRVRVLLDLLSRYEREKLVPIDARYATRDELAGNHDARYIDEVAATATKDLFRFDWDTFAMAATYDTARLAAGGLLAVIDAVMEGGADNGAALVRPPGHHAEADRAMGFCFFNNVAIGARYLRSIHGLDRVLIMDWDVHHGNGTQRSFYAGRDVLYVSTHQHPLYPGTGAADECGVADGVGHTVNVPMPAGCGDDEYIDVFDRLVVPIARQFDPQFVLVSAGFDHHHDDPLGGMRVTRRGIEATTRRLLELARDHAQNRLVAVLEGGYSLDALTESVTCMLDEMGRETGRHREVTESNADPVIEAVTRVQKRFWTL